MKSIVNEPDLETEGNTVARSCHVARGDVSGFDRDQVIQCWRDVAGRSGLAEKVLADAAEMTAGHYSKVSNGLQGDLLGTIVLIGRTYPELRSEFITALFELEHCDRLSQAAERLVSAATYFIRIQAETGQLRMARACTCYEAGRRRLA